MNPISLFFFLLYIDRFYISLIYIKSKLYSQNPKQEISKLRYNSERILYYFILLFISINISIITWNDIIYIYPLTLPQISSLIIEHPIFQYYYLQIYEYFIIILIDISCHFITLFLNFTTKILFSQTKNVISFKEIRMLVDKLDRYTLINIFRIIGFGFIYEYISYYFRFIGIGNATLNKETKRIFINELVMAFKQKNWNYILSPGNINKIFILIRESEKSLEKIRNKLYLTYISIFSYSTILYLSNKYLIVSYAIVVILIWLIEKKRFVLWYLIVCFIISLYSIETSIICLLFVSSPKIKLHYRFRINDLYWMIILLFISLIIFFQIRSNDKLHFICVYLLLIFYYICYQYNRLNINEVIVIDYFKMNDRENSEENNEWTDNISIEKYTDYTSVKDNDFVYIMNNADFNHMN